MLTGNATPTTPTTSTARARKRVTVGRGGGVRGRARGVRTLNNSDWLVTRQHLMR